MDDILILDQALTAGEMASLYAVGNDAFLIPEPATLILLSLGAFLLRRK